jgi:hypothetical protein
VTKFYRCLLLGLIVALALSACGGGGDKEGTATSAPESAPTQPAATSPAEVAPTRPVEPVPEQPAETPAGGEGEGALGDLLNLDALKTNPEELSEGPLKSYRLRIHWITEAKPGSDTISSTVEIMVAHTSEPLAEEMSFSSGEGDETSIIRIGDKSWYKIEDQWMEVSSDEMTGFGDMLFTLDSATAGLGGNAKLVGQEEVNGVATRRYSFDESIMGQALGAYSKVKGDVWVAVDGDYAVRYAFTAEDDEATYQWDWELYDINAPITIEPPAEAQGARDDIPLMTDATEQYSFGTMTTYETASDLTTVVNFYKEQMPTQGWTYDEAGSMVSDQFAMLSFTKEGVTASITVSPLDDGGTSVIIQAGE